MKEFYYLDFSIANSKIACFMFEKRLSGGLCDEAGTQHARTQSSRLGSGRSPASSGGWHTLPSGHGCPPVQQPSCGRVCVTRVHFIPARPPAFAAGEAHSPRPASRQLRRGSLQPARDPSAGARGSSHAHPCPCSAPLPSRRSKCYKRWGLQK